MSTVDGAVDCQPIVYERCYTGEALDADGDCLSERCDPFVAAERKFGWCRADAQVNDTTSAERLGRGSQLLAMSRNGVTYHRDETCRAGKRDEEEERSLPQRRDEGRPFGCWVNDRNCDIAT